MQGHMLERRLSMITVASTPSFVCKPITIKQMDSDVSTGFPEDGSDTMCVTGGRAYSIGTAYFEAASA